MSDNVIQFDQAVDLALLERCQAMGLSLAVLDHTGKLQKSYYQGQGWAEKSIFESAIFQTMIDSRLNQWAEEDTPRPCCLSEGCWVIPLALTLRRKRVGYQLVLCFTNEIFKSESLNHAFEQAGIDRQIAMKDLMSRSLMRQEEIARLAAMLYWMKSDRQSVSRQSSELEALSSHLTETYEELTLVYELSEHLSVAESPQKFINDALTKACNVIGLNWAVFVLTDETSLLMRMMDQVIAVGYIDERRMVEYGHRLFEKYGDRSSVILDDLSGLQFDDIEAITDSMIVVPIHMNGRDIGVIFCGGKLAGDGLSTVDSKLFSAVGQNINIFLDNARLYEDQHDMFMGTLRALVNSIDAKDSYTCGHSERVAYLSRELAAKAGLDEKTVERVHLSGLVHDIGKIGVPESVLCKPGRLTDEEFDAIKMHPEIGYHILKDIRQMEDLLPGVMHHHERYDGRGYPHNLSGLEIPLFGRLIGLADSFDAMSSTRTYRKSLDRDTVLTEIRDCAGTQFDPGLAKVFLTLDFTEYDRMIEEHQAKSVESGDSVTTETTE